MPADPACNNIYEEENISTRPSVSHSAFELCLVVSPLRAFFKRRIDLTCHVEKPHHLIKLTSGAENNIKT